MIIIEVTFEDEYEDNNVVDFAEFAARREREKEFMFSWEDTILSLTGGNVIYLAERRH